ncbi:MAG: wax ester/triacylglycerol synthase family O-acyltransferase [Ramlibacter sp.]
MKHLSGLDAMFLHIESAEMPMHVGSLNVLRLPEGYAGEFYEDAKAHVGKRMHLADVFTRKLALMPFDLSNPVWVEDEDIDLDYHIRHVTLPRPGSNRQLQQYVARLHSSLLDRSRPLWEFFIIDGLKSGEVALYTKVHHAGIDGQAGVELGKAILDLTAQGREIRPPRPKPRRNEYQLGMAELAGAALRNTLAQYVKLFRMLPAVVRAARDVLPPKGADGKREWKLPKGVQLLGPRTPFNVAITNQRAFAGRTLPLGEVKYIAKAFGVSLNDVVMATTSGALRRYLKESGELPARPLLAAVPVSLREQGDTSANNQVSMVRMTLATDVADPVERMRKIQASSMASKATMGRFKAIIPTDFPLFGAPWLISGLAALAGRSRLVNMIPLPVNVTISNVAGAPMPLFFAGAELTSYYPVSIPTHGLALNITVQSYNGRLDYGLIACRRAVPDVADIGDFIVAEHRKLMELATAQAAPAPAIALPAAAPALKLVGRAARPAKTAKPVAVAKRASAKPKRRTAA